VRFVVVGALLLATRNVGRVGDEDEEQPPTGSPIHGLVSHNFLRDYAWTIDFDAIQMYFAG
jgi:hypothetical protein